MHGDGQLVAIVSMDLSKAFDVIQHPLLLAKLKAYGLDEDSCTLLRDYLSNRQQRVKMVTLSCHGILLSSECLRVAS